MHGAINWVNHLIFSPDDRQAMFVHRWWPPGAPRYRTRFMLLRIDDGSVQRNLAHPLLAHVLALADRDSVLRDTG